MSNIDKTHEAEHDDERIIELSPYVQEICNQQGKFQAFDFGEKKNLEIYNNIHPLTYNLSHITTPVILFRGPADSVAVAEDVEQLHSELQNSELHVVENVKFNHLDFVLAKDAKHLVYKKLIEFIQKIIRSQSIFPHKSENHKPAFSISNLFQSLKPENISRRDI